MNRYSVLTALIGIVLCSTAISVTTIRVSTDSNETQATGNDSIAGAVDGSGNLVVFSSGATNLVANDANSSNDVFVKNRSTGGIILASRNGSGVTATGTSNAPSISADGNFVAFNSAATDLVANDTNMRSDVFVFNIANGTVSRVSINSTAAEANGQSAGTPAISANGRYVAFESTATNLVAIDTDTVADIYRHDRQTGATILISQTTAGALGGGSLGSNRPSISADGRYVAFESSRVLVADDNNSTGDIYLRDVQAGTTIRVNSSAAGVFPSAGFSARPSLAGNGRLIAFRSLADTLVPNDGTSTLRDIFVKNLDAGAIIRITAPGGVDPNGDSNELDLSADGSTLVFHSIANNLLADDQNSFQDIFRMKLNTGAIERISVATNGTASNEQSGFPRINGNGSVVAYESSATNLVDGDNNARLDVFAGVGVDAIFGNGFELP